MNIYCDFDDVLFYTAQFTEDFQVIFAQHGVDANLFATTYDLARGRDGIKNYNFTRHLEILRDMCAMNTATLEEAITRMFSTDFSRYIFADTEDFLHDIVASGHRVFIVSFGSPLLQQQKIVASGLTQYFTDMRVGEIDKADSIAELETNHSAQKAIFIDDRFDHINHVKNVHRDIDTILMMRPEGRYTQKNKETNGAQKYQQCTNMKNVAVHIKKYSVLSS